MAVNSACLFSKWKLVEVNKRKNHIPAALLQGYCTRVLAQEPWTLVCPQFEGPIRVGDAGIEPATSAV